MTTKDARIQLRRANRQSTLESVNPVLLSGEPAIALDTGILKIGDGVSTYNQLPAIGADFPDVIDGGVFYASPLGEYTFSVENIDTASITPVIAAEGQSVSTGTITLYDRATIKCSITLYINDNYTIDRSGYSYDEYDPETGRWIGQDVAGAENFLTLETTTATAAGCTFSIDWDSHVITIVGNVQ